MSRKVKYVIEDGPTGVVDLAVLQAIMPDIYMRPLRDKGRIDVGHGVTFSLIPVGHEETPHVLLVGNVLKGVVAIGPFATLEAALARGDEDPGTTADWHPTRLWNSGG